MRASLNNHRNVTKKSRFTIISVTSIFIVAGAVIYSVNAPEALADSGCPVITSFSVIDLGGNTWRLSGTVTCSEGCEGARVEFGGSIIDDCTGVESNGTFSKDVTAQPISGDWVTATAIDRWELSSEMATHYF